MILHPAGQNYRDFSRMALGSEEMRASPDP